MRKGKVMCNNVAMRQTSRALSEFRSAVNKTVTAVKTSPRRDKLTDILNEISLRTNPISEKNRELIEYSRYKGQLVRTSRRLYTKQEMLDLFAYEKQRLSGVIEDLNKERTELKERLKPRSSLSGGENGLMDSIRLECVEANLAFASSCLAKLKSLDINKVSKIGKFYDYHHSSGDVFYRSVSKEEVLKMLSPSDAKVYKIACEKGVDWDTAVNMANDIANNKKPWWRFW